MWYHSDCQLLSESSVAHTVIALPSVSIALYSASVHYSGASSAICRWEHEVTNKIYVDFPIFLRVSNEEKAGVQHDKIKFRTECFGHGPNEGTRTYMMLMYTSHQKIYLRVLIHIQ